jgi:hypothetical protein
MISDKDLYEAARKVDEAILASLPKPEECEAAFSRRFERKMKKIIRRVDHPVRYWVQKSVACFLVTILLGSSCLLALSSEARAIFLGWIREIHEEWFVYHYVGEEKDGLEGITYQPTWVPDGYEVVSEYSDPWVVNIRFQNADGKFARFSYSTYTEAFESQVERDGADVKRIFVNGYPADLYLDSEPGEPNVLIWMNDEIDAFFSISATFSGDEIIKMAESVESQEVK